MPTTTTKTAARATTEPFRVRRSPIHGTGVFATRRIKKGTRIVEYVGERLSHKEADRRYEMKEPGDNHTFLFTVDENVVIDAGVGGNAARFINHSCAPNCETLVDDDRVFVDALRTIEPGEELFYDYLIGRAPDDPPEIDEIFGCRCGAPTCRGTMLVPLPTPAKAARANAKKSAKTHAKANGKTHAKTNGKAARRVAR